jgi:hypothetical protein
MIRKLLLILCLSVTLTGCISVAGKKSTVKVGEEFVKDAVVAGFPNMPLYPKSRAIETYGEGKKFGGAFYSSEKLAKVVSFYQTALAQSGWESNLRRVSQDNYVFDVKNKANMGTVIVNTAADGEQTAITISVEPR